MKTLPATQTSRQADLQDFLAEAVITSRLEHPNIVPVYAQGTLPQGDPYIAMRLVSGQTWKKRLEHRQSGDLQDHLEILLSVCNAVAFAHTNALVEDGYRGVRTGRELAHALHILGMIEHRAGQPEVAASHLRRAQDLLGAQVVTEGDDLNLLLQRADVLCQLGQTQAALGNMDAAERTSTFVARDDGEI